MGKTLLRIILASILILTAAAPAPACADSTGGEQAQELTILQKANKAVFDALLFDILGGGYSVEYTDAQGAVTQMPVAVPFLVVLLLAGAIFFTLWYRFINIRGFQHAIQVVAGKYDKEEDTGEISHFRALTSALSATIGLGNIAGVAVAIQQGGPGAVFWMIITAVFGMTSKFSSCTLSQLYRKTNPDGSISGGPMYYLDIGLGQMGGLMKPFGKLLGLFYALMVMGGALGAGCMFQSNQTAVALTTSFGLSEDYRVYIGWLLLISVAVVILGGIKRIGAATSRIVPAMCVIYVGAALVVILVNINQLPETLSLIFTRAFSANAIWGGAVGVAVKGITRAAFSNEAGLGSAAIAHAAAKTDEPVREGIVAMIGPFIDTIVICTMTASVVLITGTWNNPEVIAAGQGDLLGVHMTAEAFRTVLPFFPYILSACVALFAYSTMIAWCYYGERGWIYILDHFGEGTGIKSVLLFRLAFCSLIVVGATNKLSDVLDFSDALLLSMAFPNIIGSIILAPRVLKLVQDYWRRYRAGEMEVA